MHLPFGKYRGQLIADVPSPYLRWLIREVRDLDDELRQAVRQELRRRQGDYASESTRQPPPAGAIALADLRTTVSRVFATLSRRHHPDRGGSQAGMVALNEAREALVEALSL
jgi:Putative quorum-sensing-regulated virulence factor